MIRAQFRSRPSADSATATRRPPEPRGSRCRRLLSLAPAAEHEAAEREAEPERADGEAADGECFTPRRQALPAAERLARAGRQRLAAALLAKRAAGAKAEVEIVEDLGGLVGHEPPSMASPAAGYARRARVGPALRRRRRRGDRARGARSDRAIRARARDRKRRSQPPRTRGPARPCVAVPPRARPPRARDSGKPRHPVHVPGALHALVPRVRAPVGNDRTDLFVADAARDRPQLRAPVAAPVRRRPDGAARARRGAVTGRGAGRVPDRRAAPPHDRGAVAIAEEARRAPEPRPGVARRGWSGSRRRRPHPPGRRERAPRIRDLPRRRARRRRVDRPRARATAAEAAG